MNSLMSADAYEDLIQNPTPRCTCILVLDVSSSMDGNKIRLLNDAVDQFIREIQEDDFASQAIELGVVTFGDVAEVALPIVPIHAVEGHRPLVAEGMTAMGAGVNVALAELDSRKESYKKTGVSYYQPWLVLMSDGEPTDDNWQDVARRSQQLAEDGKVVILSVGIGSEANLITLSAFSRNGWPARPLAGLKFKEFFKWLSASMASVSRSIPGDKVPLATTSGWDSI